MQQEYINMKNPFTLSDKERRKENLKILKKIEYEDNLDRVCNYIYWVLGF